MQSTNPFVVKFASSLIAVLGCQDRVIFKGHLPFSDEAHLNRYLFSASKRLYRYTAQVEWMKFLEN
jgi:hypothetical protein